MRASCQDSLNSPGKKLTAVNPQSTDAARYRVDCGEKRLTAAEKKESQREKKKVNPKKAKVNIFVNSSFQLAMAS